jgi:hypothetical protein
MAAVAAMPLGGYPVKTGLTYTETAADALRAALVPDKTSPTVYTADGAIDPTVGTAVLSKTSAAAMTLRAPTAVEEGTRLEITTGTAYAHVVTATGLLNDGVTGGAKDAWTAAAFVGSSLVLRAYNLKWQVISKNLGTIA